MKQAPPRRWIATTATGRELNDYPGTVLAHTLLHLIALVCFFLTLFALPFKSKSRLEAENAALRHQLIVLQRRVTGRVQLRNGDRLFLVMLYRWFPSILKAITIVRPETLVRWHRAGFRRYWRWKSRSLGGRPQIDAEPFGQRLGQCSDGELLLVVEDRAHRTQRDIC